MPWSREIGVLIFLVIIPLMLFSLQFFLYRRLQRWIREQMGGARWLLLLTRVLFVAFNAAFLLVVVLRPDARSFPPWLVYAGEYPFMIWHGSTFFISLVLLLWRGVALLLSLPGRALMLVPALKRRADQVRENSHYRKFDESRRAFLRKGTFGLAAATMGGTTYGMFIGRHDYDVTEAEFEIGGLPEAFDGFTIGLVSDIHAGAFMLKEEMREYVKVINDLGSDLIAVPGDFVNGRLDEVFPFAEAFSDLRAPFGVYGVLGNHDYYTGDPERVAREVNGAGVRLLRDESLLIRRNGEILTLAGVDDVGRNDRAPIQLDRALEAAPENETTILLCHRPYYLRQAASRDISLVLSGHTHGGQIVFGRFGNAILTPAAFASHYIAGKYAVGKTHMYVSRGIGTVGLPVRLNCPPEITRIILRRSS